MSFVNVPLGPSTVTFRALHWTVTPSGIERVSIAETSFIVTRVNAMRMGCLEGRKIAGLYGKSSHESHGKSVVAEFC